MSDSVKSKSPLDDHGIRERIIQAAKFHPQPENPNVIAYDPIAAARAALLAVRAQIQEKCGMCDGHGFTIETGTESGHACDGTEVSCLQNCPVPIPVQVQEPCEYCGRPNEVVDTLLASLDPQERKEEQPHVEVCKCGRAKDSIWHYFTDQPGSDDLGAHKFQFSYSAPEWRTKAVNPPDQEPT